MRLTSFEPPVEKLGLASLGKPAIVGAIALVVMVAVVAGRIMIDTATANVFEVEPAREQVEKTEQFEQANPGAVYVHVAGCVASPGVVELQEGARVGDAVAAAGGFAPDAAEDAVNLARVVKDGEQVYIPSTDQALSDSAEQGPGREAQAGQTATGGQAALVNINTAGSTELQSLPGIGPSTAAKIVDYRNANGSFSACEDLKNVSGIGDKKYEAIEGLICV